MRKIASKTKPGHSNFTRLSKSPLVLFRSSVPSKTKPATSNFCTVKLHHHSVHVKDKVYRKN